MRARVGAFLGALALAHPAWSQEGAAATHVAAAERPVDSELQQTFGRALVDHSLGIGPSASVMQARQTLLRRASLFEAVNEFAMAESDLTAALEMQPPVASLYGERGYFYMRRGRYGEALADFVIGMRLDSDSPLFHFAAGRAAAALGDYAGAVTYYDEAIGLAARNPAYYLARAEAQIHLDQPRDAVADYDRALDIKLPLPSDRYFAYAGRGYAQMMLADYASAISDFNRALEIDPRAVSALVWRGYARERGGQVALALDDYERAATVDPTDRRARDSVRRLRAN
jgi:tetratricopeptide (TPR) repeat protein